MDDQVEKYVKNFLRTMPSEDLYFEAIRDVVKDLIKEYIKKKINDNEEIKNEIVSVLELYLESKLKEYDSMARMTKVTAELGLLSTPASIKDEAINELLKTFKKEIEEIIKKTF